MLETSFVPGSERDFGGIRTAPSVDGFRQSTLREIMGKAGGPGFVSFAVGTPGTDLLPLEEIARASSRVLKGDHRILQYGLPASGLTARIVELMELRGVSCREEQIVLTTGSQQGMALLSRLLLDPGDSVVLEEAIYDGILMAVRGRSPRILTVPSDPDEGLDLDALERLLEKAPAPGFLYVIPEGHNPLGSSLSETRRARLVEIARRHRLPVVEDDVYGLLGLEEGTAVRTPPPLRARDERWILYLGSLSKTLAPGLRIGWAVVPDELVPKLSALKHAADVDTCTVSQHVTAAYLDEGLFPARLERLRGEYRRRRDTLLEALERHLPASARWNRPRSGIFVWVDLPEGTDTTALLERAIEEGVAFCPGEAFAAGDPAPLRRSMRMSFADTPVERIEEGVERLARAIGAMAGQGVEGLRPTGSDGRR